MAASSILRDVNPEQHAAITHGEGPLLVVAGAGSGKTRVITRRVAHLVDRGVAPWEIVALTFTNKAAREMRERVEALVRAPELWVCTFHSFAARTLRMYGDRLGYDRTFSIYDTDDKLALIRRILKDERIDDLRPAAVAQALSRMKNGLEREEDAWDEGRLSRVLRIYEERMRDANAMDFDDLLVRLGELLDEDAAVHERLRARARWLLVDEYQDTNTVQYRILRRLAGDEQNVCATGDPDQSIYRWRGATLRNILDFERDFPGARLVTLDRNYRSTKAILAVANAVIRFNLDRYEKDLRTENPPGCRVREIRCIDEAQEGAIVAREALAWIARGRAPRDIAVFYRTNAQSRSVERGLRDRGVPYRIVGSVEFYKRQEVKDVLAYVRVARNPRDDGALRRVFNTPARGLGARTEERVFGAAVEAGVPARELLRDRAGLARFGRARRALLQLAELLDRIEALPAEEPRAFVEGVIEATGYRAHLGEGGDAPETDRLLNVDELVNAAAEFQAREPEAGIDGFLEENALVSDQDTWDGTADAVSLMTVHSAKGLEFPCVIVTGLEQQVFPHALSLDEPAGLEEERRLFYVATTRACEELVLTHAQARLRQGRTVRSRPSCFLDEVPDDLLEVEDLTDLYGGDDEAVFDVREDEGPGWHAGDRVRHHHFGVGRILAVRASGGATRVTVDFTESGRRELSLAYARLERI